MRHILVILAVVAAAAIAGVSLYQWVGGPEAPPPAPMGTMATGDAPDAVRITPDDFTLGDPDAPVTVIEYASMTCPHCANFHNAVFPEIRKAYIDTGLVLHAYRDFPLDGAALRAAMVARCAGEERYFAFVDLIFSRLESWASAPDPVAGLRRLAGLGGMDESEFDACLADQDVERAVLESRMEGEQAFGVNATPSFVINGTLYSGGLNFTEFKRIVDPLIAKTDN